MQQSRKSNQILRDRVRLLSVSCTVLALLVFECHSVIAANDTKKAPTVFSTQQPKSIAETVNPVSLVSFKDHPIIGRYVFDTEAFRRTQLSLRWCRVLFHGSTSKSLRPALVTWHQTDESQFQLCRIYFGNQAKWQPTDEFVYSDCQLQCALEFQQGRDEFMLFRIASCGSSCAYNYELLSLGRRHVAENSSESPQIRRISLENPATKLKHLFAPDQTSSPHRCFIDVKNGELNFTFSVWNPTDRSNFPTGGHFTGAMKLVLGSDGKPARFVVKSWKHQDKEE